MRIAIIGHTGFIGAFLVNKLSALGHSITGLDIREQSGQRNYLTTSIVGNILSPDDVHNTVRDTDLVIALAAKHHDFGVSREEFFEVNERGTHILLDAMTKESLNKLIFYSTVAVYGTQITPTTEATIPQPDSDYGDSKLAAENLLKQWADRDKRRSITIIRPTVVYGPRNYANVYNLIDKIYRRRFLFVGKGDNIKSIAYVENLVDANIFLIDKIKSGVQVFNYTDEPQMTISQIVNIISRCFSYHSPRVKVPLHLATTFGSVLDLAAKISGHNLPITAARMRKFATPTHHTSEKIRTLGFVQRIETEEGFRRMTQWYLEELGKKKK